MCKRNQSHTDRCRNLLFVACADGVLVELGGLDVVPYAGVFVVSVLGTVVIAIIGVFWLLRFVFVDFSYEEDAEDEQ